MTESGGVVAYLAMKAAVLYQTGKPLVIDELETPELRRGQVLVKLRLSGVCHSQLMEARGLRGEDRYLPHLLGHEGVGIVESIGPEVTKVARGDRVVLGWLKGSGLEGGSVQYRNRNGQQINAGSVTTFSEFSVVSENRLTKVPNAIQDSIAVLFGCAVPTGAGIVLNELKPAAGSSLAIFGLGGIGLSALMACTDLGLKRIIAVDVEHQKLELAQKLGATDVIDASSCDPQRAMMEVTDGAGVDYAIEATGLAKMIEKAFACLSKNGQLVFASHPQSGDKITLDPFELISGKKIAGSWGGRCYPDRDLPHFFDLYCAGKLPLDAFESATYPLDAVNQALADLEQRKVTRAILSMGASSA